MDILHAIILGIIQGLTEFLPVSSSGHLEIVKVILNAQNIGKQSMLMTVVLHGATALSTIYIFRNDILEIIKGLFSGVKTQINFSVKIIFSMMPAAVVGLFFEKEIEYSRNWHWMWSKFYFNKKHYGYLKAFLMSLPTIITSVVKSFYYLILINKHKRKIYIMRFLGLFNSMIGKKSWYRPRV